MTAGEPSNRKQQHCFCLPADFCPHLYSASADTKLSSRPAPFSLTSTSFHKETRQRSVSGSVPPRVFCTYYISPQVIFYDNCAARLWFFRLHEAGLTSFSQSTVLLQFLFCALLVMEINNYLFSKFIFTFTKSLWVTISSYLLVQGIILSGGQKQRISVARALYQQTNVVFLVSLYRHRAEGFIKRVTLVDWFDISAFGQTWFYFWNCPA